MPVWKGSKAFAQEDNIETLSAGTAMVIPSWIMDEYKANSYLYSRPFNYLVDHYTVIGPSYLEEGESTYYIPLTSTEKDNTIPESKITMVDIANIKQHPQDKSNRFVTIKNIKAPIFNLKKSAKDHPAPIDKNMHTEAGAPCIEGCFQNIRHNTDYKFILPIIAIGTADNDQQNLMEWFIWKIS